MADTLLRVRDLHVAYGKVEALSGIDIEVSEGRIATVIGPNGAGKTTMLSALIGLLPSSGSIEFEAVACRGASVERRVGMGMNLVPEKRELFGEMSVQDNLLLGGFDRWRRRDRAVAETLEEIYALFPRLRDRRDQLAGTLSGGERQMLALGRALMAKPRLLMLDEPSLGLAPLIVREIFRIIATLRDRGVSILLVEQNARAALAVADTAYVLENGQVTLQGDAKDLAHDPRVIEVYLGLAGKHQDRLAA
ncbi:ABC transporter ATP-binding protein [Derxia gummosa]|uniref:ABC transporter ATP-binding protein n=1 Tax=Derxia gummosa DSM 723 TaxID=1121388 RepID=A0A8B6X4I4_9BURK|nr:ABC transporter ATP-binding protein [Derxia gummosa]